MTDSLPKVCKISIPLSFLAGSAMYDWLKYVQSLQADSPYMDFDYSEVSFDL